MVLAGLWVIEDIRDWCFRFGDAVLVGIIEVLPIQAELILFIRDALIIADWLFKVVEHDCYLDK